MDVPLEASCGGGQFQVPAPLEPHALPQLLTCESRWLLLGSACASQLATCTTAPARLQQTVKRNRKEETTPFGVNSSRSPVLYCTARVQQTQHPFGLWPMVIAPGCRLRRLPLCSLKSIKPSRFLFVSNRTIASTSDTDWLLLTRQPSLLTSHLMVLLTCMCGSASKLVQVVKV